MNKVSTRQKALFNMFSKIQKGHTIVDAQNAQCSSQKIRSHVVRIDRHKRAGVISL